MQLSIRPCLTAGVAIAGAGMIAVTPVASRVPDVHLPAIQLSAAEGVLDLAGGFGALADLNPITPWMDVFGAAFTNVSEIAGHLLANPAPVLTQLLSNQLGYGQTIATSLQDTTQALLHFVASGDPYQLTWFLGQTFDSLMSGNFSEAAGSVSNILLRLVAPGYQLLPMMQIPVSMAQHVTNVLAAVPEVVIPIGLSVLNPVEGVINAFGDNVQLVADALGDGDLVAAFGALVDAPASLTGALLNGYQHATAGLTTGLLSVGQIAFARGVVENLLVTLPETLAKALGAGDAATLGAASVADGVTNLFSGLPGLDALPDLSALLGDLGGGLSALLGDLGGDLSTLLPAAMLDIPQLLIEAVLGSV